MHIVDRNVLAVSDSLPIFNVVIGVKQMKLPFETRLSPVILERKVAFISPLRISYVDHIESIQGDKNLS